MSKPTTEQLAKELAQLLILIQDLQLELSLLKRKLHTQGIAT